MRKRFAVLLLSALALCMLNNRAHAQRGKVMIDFYYGFPNLWSSALERVVDAQFTPAGLDFSSVGPLGGRVEVMVSNRIGLGVDVLFAESGLDFTTTGPDPNGEGGTAEYSYAITVKRPRVLGRLNVHLMDNRFLDPYFVVGLGYNGTKAIIQTDDPIFNAQDFNLPFSLPVAARVGFGMRVMVLKFLGVGAEIGIGGPLVTGGVTLKI